MNYELIMSRCARFQIAFLWNCRWSIFRTGFKHFFYESTIFV